MGLNGPTNIKKHDDKQGFLPALHILFGRRE